MPDDPIAYLDWADYPCIVTGCSGHPTPYPGLFHSAAELAVASRPPTDSETGADRG